MALHSFSCSSTRIANFILRLPGSAGKDYNVNDGEGVHWGLGLHRLRLPEAKQDPRQGSRGVPSH